jgi:hypothetical protein
VALIVAATLGARGAEWLAGARTCPNRSVIWPSGEAQGETPPTDAGEEVALIEPSEVGGLHVNDASLVNDSGRDVASGDEVSEPGSGIGVDLVVVGRHHMGRHVLFLTMPLTIQLLTSNESRHSSHIAMPFLNRCACINRA